MSHGVWSSVSATTKIQRN